MVMKRYIIYTALMAAMVLTGCKGHNEVEEPVEGQEITLSFSMASEVQLPNNAAAAPSRIPGDPGKDDFVAPENLYFVVWAQAKDGDTKYMRTVRVEGLTPSNWTHAGNGIYNLTDKQYKFKLPKSGGSVSLLTNDAFYVYGFASTENLLDGSHQLGGITFNEYVADQELTSDGAAEKATLDGLAYSIPSGVDTPEKKRDFFRSMYSTALSETSHNQMATSPTIRLRHTAARLDINWECETATTGLPKDQTSPLTANSTWEIALASDIMPSSFSLFQPGNNVTGSNAWSETITIDEGMRYNGRYVTYLPMPTTPTFTVTSSDDAINPDGADAVAKKTKTLDLEAGSNVNYATWLRALWTIKQKRL